MKLVARYIQSALFSTLMLILVSPAGHADPVATFVDGSFVTSSAGSGGAQYDFASVSVLINPASTFWVAWNNQPTVSLANAGCSAFAGGAAGTCLGPGGFGTDDYIRLTVTNPLGGFMTVNMDQNDAYGVSFGPQNVIFGTAANAPDALRQRPYFAYPPGQINIFNEAGALNSIFTSAGNYRFDFSFRNIYGGTAGHSNIYLLVEPVPVPEPANLLLLGMSAGGLAVRLRRRKRT